MVNKKKLVAIKIFITLKQNPFQNIALYYYGVCKYSM